MNIFWNEIYSCDGQAEFSAAITPVSHDPSEKIINYKSCWFGAQETFLTIINVENSAA